MTAQTSIRDQLRELLAEGAAGAIHRERTSFDESAGAFGKSLVLFGAGNLGRKTLTGLRNVGNRAVGFCGQQFQAVGATAQWRSSHVSAGSRCSLWEECSVRCDHLVRRGLGSDARQSSLST